MLSTKWIHICKKSGNQTTFTSIDLHCMYTKPLFFHRIKNPILVWRGWKKFFYTCGWSIPLNFVNSAQNLEDSKKSDGSYLSRLSQVYFSSFNLLSLSLSSDSTASIIARRRRFHRLTQELYEVPVVVWDDGEPVLSSTGTLTLTVCSCQRGTRLKICQGEAFLLSAGLSTGALIAILLCVLILLGRLISVFAQLEYRTSEILSLRFWYCCWKYSRL